MPIYSQTRHKAVYCWHAMTTGCPVQRSLTSCRRRIRSRYTFSRKENTGSRAQRSSLYRLASTRDRCGPAAASMQHVTAAVSAWSRSASPTYRQHALTRAER